MKNLTLILISISLLLIIGCNTNSEKQIAIESIQQLEQIVYSDSLKPIDKNFASNLVLEYKKFYKNYPKDTACANYLFKAGEIAMNLGMSTQALGFFSSLQQNFTNSPNYSYSIFLQGFVYDNLLQNPQKAKIFYSLFLEKFPNHELADDAQALITNLGKSNEEIIKAFEEQNK